MIMYSVVETIPTDFSTITMMSTDIDFITHMVDMLKAKDLSGIKNPAIVMKDSCNMFSTFAVYIDKDENVCIDDNVDYAGIWETMHWNVKADELRNS